MNVEMDYFSWRDFGINKGWITDPFCYTHDTPPTTEEEDAEFEEGDPCLFVFRIWEEAIKDA